MWIVIEWCGRWCFYHETFMSESSARKLADDLDAFTMVLSAREIAQQFGYSPNEPKRLDYPHDNAAHYVESVE
jgi:hypothetical protein